MKHKLNRLTALLLAVIMAFSMLLVPVEAASFADVSAKAWYKSAVDFVSEKGFMVGVSETRFAPETNVTRAMFVTVLASYAGASVKNDTTVFEDVRANKWYTGSVTWAAQNGLVSGVGNGRFAPNAEITRQDLCAILRKFVSLQGYELAQSADRTFSDAGTIASYAKDAVAYCAQVGLISGYEDGSFRPKKTATRAEVAQILMKLFKLTDSSVLRPAQTFSTVCSDTMSVSVNAPTGALPSGTEMTASVVTDEDKLADMQARISGRLVTAADITFTKDGSELEPEREVEVRIAAEELLSCKNLVVYHFADDGSVERIASEMVSETRGVSDRVLTFQAKDFSVYAVFEDTNTSHVTVHFMSKEDYTNASSAWRDKQQRVRVKAIKESASDALVVYDPGIQRAAQDMTFKGWRPGNETEPSTEDLMTIGDINDYLRDNYKNSTEDVDLYFYADTCYVTQIYYYNQAGAITRVQTMELDGTKTQNVMVVDHYYIPMLSDQNFENVWLRYDPELTGDARTIVPSQTYPEYKPAALTSKFENGTKVTVKKGEPLRVFPYLKRGIWISFNNNEEINNNAAHLNFREDTTAAEYVAPMFFEYNQTITKADLPGPANTNPKIDKPTRPGYTFVGWYKDPNLNHPLFESDSATFKLEESMILYAKWEFATAPYYANYWLQSVQDDPDLPDRKDLPDDSLEVKNGHYKHYVYQYQGTENVKTGAYIKLGTDGRLYRKNKASDAYTEIAVDRNGRENILTNFFYDYREDLDTVGEIRVRGDGTTVLNAYVDRKVITYNIFRRWEDIVADPGKYLKNVTGDSTLNANKLYFTYVSNYTNYSNPPYFPMMPTIANCPDDGTMNASSASYFTWVSGFGGYGSSLLYAEGVGRGSAVYEVQNPRVTLRGLYGSKIEEFPDFIGQSNPAISAPLYQWFNIVNNEKRMYYNRSIFDFDTFNPLNDPTYRTLTMNFLESKMSVSKLRYLYYALQDINGNYPTAGTGTINSYGANHTLGTAEAIYYHRDHRNGFQIIKYTTASSEPNFNVNAATNVAFNEDDSYQFYHPTYGGTRSGTEVNNHTVIFLKRNQWDIIYKSNNEDVKTVKNVFYEKPLKDVTFQDNGQTIGLKQYVPTNGKPGYYFDGWYEDPSCQQPMRMKKDTNEDILMPNENVVYYAKWVPIKYRIVLDFYNGVPDGEKLTFPLSMSSVYLLGYGGQIAFDSIASASRQNYVFDGWFLDPECTVPFDVMDTHITDDIPGMDLHYRDRREGESDAEYRARLQGFDPATSEWYYDDLDPTVRRKLVLYARWVKRIEGIDGVEIHYLSNHDAEIQTGYFSPDEELRDMTDGLVYTDGATVITQDASTPDNELSWRFRNWQLLMSDGTPSDYTYYPGAFFTVDLDYASEEQIWENGATAWTPIHTVHDFTGVSAAAYKAPDCNHWGHLAGSKRCNICGHYYMKDMAGNWLLAELEPTEHDLIVTREDKPCDENALITEYCTICHERAIYVDRPHDHTWEYEGEKTEPTCTEIGGFTKRTCSYCGKVETNGVIPALGHKEGTDIEWQAHPTCTTGGHYTYTCLRCGLTNIPVEVPANGHGEVTYDDFEDYMWVSIYDLAGVQNVADLLNVTPLGDRFISDEDVPTADEVLCFALYHCPNCGEIIYAYQSYRIWREGTPATTSAEGSYTFHANFNDENIENDTFVVSTDKRPGYRVHFFSRGAEIYVDDPRFVGTEANGFMIDLPEEAEELEGYEFAGWCTRSSYGPARYLPEGMYEPGEPDFAATSEQNLYAVYAYSYGFVSVQLADSVVAGDRIVMTSGTEATDYIFLSTDSQTGASTMGMMVSDSGLLIDQIPDTAWLTLGSSSYGGYYMQNNAGKILDHKLALRTLGDEKTCGFTFSTGNPKQIRGAYRSAFYIGWNSSLKQFQGAMKSGLRAYIWKEQNDSVLFFEILQAGAGGDSTPTDPAAEMSAAEMTAPKTLGLDSKNIVPQTLRKAEASAQTASGLSGQPMNALEAPEGFKLPEDSEPTKGNPLGADADTKYELVEQPADGEKYLIVAKYGTQYKILSNSYFYSGYSPVAIDTTVNGDGTITASDLSAYEFRANLVDEETGKWSFAGSSGYLGLESAGKNLAFLETETGSAFWNYDADEDALVNTDETTGFRWVRCTGDYMSSYFESSKSKIYFFERKNQAFTVTIHYEVYEWTENGLELASSEAFGEPYVGTYRVGDVVNVLTPMYSRYLATDEVVNFVMPAKDVEGTVTYWPKYLTYQSELWIPETGNPDPDETYLIAMEFPEYMWAPDGQGNYFIEPGTGRTDYVNEKLVLFMSHSECTPDLEGIVNEKFHSYVNPIPTDEREIRAGWAALPVGYYFDGEYIDEAHQMIWDETEYNMPEIPLQWCTWKFSSNADGTYTISSNLDPNYKMYANYGGIYPSATKYNTWKYDKTKHLLYTEDYLADYGSVVYPSFGFSGVDGTGEIHYVRSEEEYTWNDGTVIPLEQMRSRVYLFKRVDVTKEKWRIYLVDDEGVWMDSVDVPDGARLSDYISDPKKIDMTFQHWTTKDGTAVNLDETYAHDNLYLYAYFTPNYRTSYVVYLRANYDPWEAEGKTHIYWYANNGTLKNNHGGARVEDTGLDVDEAVTIPYPYPVDYGTTHITTPTSKPNMKEDRMFYETNEDTINHEVGLNYVGYKFVGWAKVPADEAGIGADHSDLTAEDVYLYWNGNEFILNDPTDEHHGQRVEKIAPDDLTGSEDMYAVWEPINYFYVFHSSTGEVVAYDWDEVTNNGKQTFNLVDHVYDGYLYGGYYHSYGYISADEMRLFIMKLFYGSSEGSSENPWRLYEESTLPEYGAVAIGKTGVETYDGHCRYINGTNKPTARVDGNLVVVPPIWKAADAYKSAANSGLTLAPEIGAVYYLKEVPSYYLNSKMLYTYNKKTDDPDFMKLSKLWMVSVADDTNYSNVGFQYQTGENLTEVAASRVAARDIFVRSIVFTDFYGKKIEVNAGNFFTEEGNPMNPDAGYVMGLELTDPEDLLANNGNFTMIPCWETFDGVLVQNNVVNWKKNLNPDFGDDGQPLTLMSGKRGLLAGMKLYLDFNPVGVALGDEILDTFAVTVSTYGYKVTVTAFYDEVIMADTGREVTLDLYGDCLVDRENPKWCFYAPVHPELDP